MARVGGCNCGAVRFEVATELSEAGACHCGMCQKFTGGVFVSVQVPAGEMTLLKDEGLSLFSSSDWAERGFCGRCGSSLFYRITAPGPMQGEMHVGLGTLDDAGGIKLVGEIYVDRKPVGYSFAEDTHKMTEAEFVAMISGG